MTPGERYFIREKIAQEKPEHLGGFDEGWLFVKEVEMRFGKVIQLFSVEGFYLKLVTTLVC